MSSPAIPIEERFWSKVDRRSDDGCWNWTGNVWFVGYGTIWNNGKQEYAHRWAWILSRGPIPAGMCVCHRCDNRLCCNPAHLFLGTISDNMRDKVAKGRTAKGNQLPIA